MGTRNVALPKDLEAFVDAKIKSGEYAHASEVVRDGLRMLMRDDAAKLAALRDAIAEGIRDARAGRVIPADKAFKMVRESGLARLRTRRERK